MKSRWFLALALFWRIEIPTDPVHDALPVGRETAVPRAQGDFGTIKGRLVWGGDKLKPVRILVREGQAPKDRGVCAAAQAIPDPSLVVDPRTKGVRYAFAYLDPPRGENPEALKLLIGGVPLVAVDQKNCEFFPHAVAVHQSQSVEFTSQDPVPHNVHSEGRNNPFNRVLAPNDRFETRVFAERRPVRIMCDIHTWMWCYVMVFDHPFFAVTGTKGTFEIPGVPPGQQNLVLWHESKGFVTRGLSRGRDVIVKAGEVTDIGDIVLK